MRAFPMLASATLALLLAACGTTADTASHTPATADYAKPNESIGSDTECRARGGEWKQLGRAPVEQCLLPTTDAGKACSDGRECEGQCLAVEGTADGARATGQCSVDTNSFGCQTRLRDGVATTICVD